MCGVDGRCDIGGRCGAGGRMWDSDERGCRLGYIGGPPSIVAKHAHKTTSTVLVIE